MNKDCNTNPASPQPEPQPATSASSAAPQEAVLAEEDKTIADSAAPVSNAALDRLIAEAEDRGYRRGRNEKISLSMEQWEISTDLAPDLLLTPRKSMWD